MVAYSDEYPFSYSDGLISLCAFSTLLYHLIGAAKRLTVLSCFQYEFSSSWRRTRPFPPSSAPSLRSRCGRGQWWGMTPRWSAVSWGSWCRAWRRMWSCRNRATTRRGGLRIGSWCCPSCRAWNWAPHLWEWLRKVLLSRNQVYTAVSFTTWGGIPTKHGGIRYRGVRTRPWKTGSYVFCWHRRACSTWQDSSPCRGAVACSPRPSCRKRVPAACHNASARQTKRCIHPVFSHGGRALREKFSSWFF